MLQVRVAPFQASFPVSFVFIGALAAAVALTGRPVLAQPSGATVNGTVTDESGGVVARADVTLAQASSGVQRRAVTDDRGTFQRHGAGFAPARVEGVTLSAGEQRSFTVTLKVGSLADQVSVTATPDAYVAGPVTVGKIPASLRETPQSISVVTRERLEHQNFTDIGEALRYTTGVTVLSAGGAYTDYGADARGAAGDFQADGMNLLVDTRAAMFDLALYDRVEVLRGPAGLF